MPACCGGVMPAPVLFGPFTCIRYRPTLRFPVCGFLHTKRAKVMYGPPSPSFQVTGTGKRVKSKSLVITSLQGPYGIIFGSTLFRERLSQSLSISCSWHSRARAILFLVASKFDTTGAGLPSTLLNHTVGPPLAISFRQMGANSYCGLT